MTDIPDKNKSEEQAPEEITAGVHQTAEEAYDALESFLHREQEQKPLKKPSKMNRNVLILIIAVAAVALLVGAYFIIRNLPVAQSTQDNYIEAEMSATVDEAGVHQADVVTDDGEMRQNGVGTLLGYTPSQIEEINVENTAGTFTVTAHTPDGEATEYALAGYENYPMQEGIADAVANDAAYLAFSKVASADGALSDFGLSAPRATVRVKYTDGTSAMIRVGNEAAAEAGVYVAFGDKSTVYLVESDSVDSFFYSALDFISLAVTDAAEDADTSEFSTLTISGTHYPDDIVIEPNTDEAINAAYVVVSPKKMFADNVESYDIAGSIRGLYAEEVICVAPSGGQLSSYGLQKPYARIKAVYPDTTVTLMASAPGDDGLVNLYNPDKNIVYTIQVGAVTWASTDIKALTPETVLDINKEAVKGITVKTGGKSYSIDVTTVTEQVENDEGEYEDITTTTATCGDTRLSPENFGIFFQNITDMKNLGMTDSTAEKEAVVITVSYTTGRKKDTIGVYTSPSSTYPLALNGEIIGAVSKSYAEKLITSTEALVKGESLSGT